MSEPMVVVFDLDGTLADDSHRLHYIEDSQGAALLHPDWRFYYKALSEDTPRWPIVKLMHGIVPAYMECRAEIWTGRSEQYRERTEAWLYKHKIRYSALRMRADWDKSSNVQVKALMYERAAVKPKLIVDDNLKVIEYFQGLGVMTLAAGTKYF